MEHKLLLGPLLALEEENTYGISFLTQEGVSEATVICNGKPVKAVKTEELLTGTFWKASFTLLPEAASLKVNYYIEINRQKAIDKQIRTDWAFTIPAKNEDPKLAYVSCNGFSSYEIMKNTENPYHLWERLLEQHDADPYALMIMGGDQIYADGIWTEVKLLRSWSHLKISEQVKVKAGSALIVRLREFYENLYIDRWSQKELSLAMATIPHVMMWDDHDIFDGWGSYPAELQNCSVYQAIFDMAKNYFRIFQLRGRPMLSTEGRHQAFAVHYRNYSVLAMDHRSERTLTSVMAEDQWNSVINWFKNVEMRKNLLIMSGVPLVYRDFSSVEDKVSNFKMTEELTDDLKDHWRAREHQGERLRLIHQLLSELKVRTERISKNTDSDVWIASSASRTVILSGDVHVGAIGVITDKREAKMLKVHQVISSGIVHPPPTFMEWAGIRIITNDDNEYLNEDKTIEAAMLNPVGSDKYIRARNFATLKEGTDKKLWINWINESKDKAEYPLD